VKDSGGTTIQEAKYDALGRRIEVHNPSAGTTTRFYYTRQKQIIETTDGSDTVQKVFVWGNYIDELILYEDVAGVGDSSSAGDEFFALRHHNYNVVALVDDTGTVQERYDYNPFGERMVLDADFSDDSDGNSDFGLKIGHQGLYHDTVTGLIYNRARVLNPALGRLMQRDPLGYVDGMSLYGYLKSNPLKYRDPRGTNTKCCDGKGYDPEKECCNDDNEIYGCPKGTCDKWTYDVQVIGGGGIYLSGIGVGGELKASSDCCMDDHSKSYAFAGFGAGLSAGGSASPGSSHSFTTDCIGWSGHLGLGSVQGSAAAVFGGGSAVLVSTPQTNFIEAGPSFGLDISIYDGQLGAWFYNS
jgi:RHS repeat-associated protein